MKALVGLAAVLVLLALTAHSVSAQALVAEVSGVAGAVSYQPAGEQETAARVGSRFGPGTTVRVGPGAAVDIYLGSEAGVVRLTQNSVLKIEKLQHTNAITDIYLHLQQGTVLGNGSKVRPGLRYQIKVANGVAAVGNAAFRLHAEGFLVVVNGKAQFAYVTPSGQVEVFALSAPPAAYFSPVEGVKGAPKALVREIVEQSKATLGSR